MSGWGGLDSKPETQFCSSPKLSGLHCGSEANFKLCLWLLYLVQGVPGHKVDLLARSSVGSKNVWSSCAHECWIKHRELHFTFKFNSKVEASDWAPTCPDYLECVEGRWRRSNCLFYGLRGYWTGLCRWPAGILDHMLQMIWRNIWLNHTNDSKERRTEYCRWNEGILDWNLQIRRNSGLNNAGDLFEYRTECCRFSEGIFEWIL